ncbi:MAG: TSCPD domain-containing protein, partial [Clostridia bacterium]|nr:TSCPD domain-containing protein [Clostridia bacterium]
ETENSAYTASNTVDGTASTTGSVAEGTLSTTSGSTAAFTNMLKTGGFAVSKTVNFPASATRDDVREVYLLAFREGCKGVTIYRDGSRAGQVLNIGKVNDGKGESKDAETSLPENYGKIEPRPRPLVTRGFTEKMNIGCGTLYVTVNYDENGICEVFTSTGKAGGCPSQSEATARLASIALRSGISMNEVYDQLKGIRCPSTIRQKNMSCTSCPDAIARVLLKVSKYIDSGADYTTPDAQAKTLTPQPAPAPQSGEISFVPLDASDVPANAAEVHVCPECGGKVEHEGGCVICRTCGFSKCG